ncbi:hypothetical protein DPSP01_005468 [Paraphaeosphaeria sporulosa]|uniref:Uncharacterized protein n=1 Tax=Paraphaeosphaeria sporulosa TaxID=1460663 RepID=A0A177CEV5_9PLEO|nr:uncharacterized protein CC84DRAFT_1218625 [Paraphaeosphaeria sporulosa]OAG05260.1 hypothetical protein CC84DRAFT_1218625 [Paraphaeosphaeria sporulosa]
MAQWEKKRTQEIEKMISETNDEPTQIDRIAEMRGWFRPPEDGIVYPAVQDYVNGTADLEATVSKITKPIDEALAKNSGKDQLDDAWYPIIHSAKRIPYSDADRHSKLVELVKALKEHPEPSATQDNPKYMTLAGLPMAVREAWNDSPRHDIGSVPQEIRAYTNFNYFIARLTDDGLFTASHVIIWAMREALENTPQPLPWSYDAHVPAAAMWAIVLGKKLYEREEDLTPRNANEGNPARGGDLWNGGPVFSKERWAFWKKRFGDVVGQEGISEETKNIAKAAFEAMDKAESS